MKRQSTRNAVVFGLACTVMLIGATSWLTTRSLAAGPPINEHIRKYTEVLGVLQEHYVEEPESKELVYDSIQFMLQRLDPHSSFLSEDTLKAMQDEQRGSFSGLGIVVQKRGDDKPLVVISPIDGTPAARLGIRSGDIITEIEGESTDGLDINDAVKKLRGRKGTEVAITIARAGYDEPLHLTVVRDDIPTDSVRDAYMIRPETGYIRITNFTMTTPEELDRAIDELLGRGMKELVLDLRGNPGGLLDIAVEVSSRFIDAGQLVVYTRGRVPNADKEYYSSGAGNRGQFPLVVLVNHGSASASEIVSGAVQDHDRGLVVGETTWGKGLVQSVYTLSHRNGLALTTAKYYTPSGRLIQRRYDDLEEYYLYFQDEDGGDEPSSPAEIPLDEREVFHTDTGRIVYGGGGITPDRIVPRRELSPFMTRLTSKAAFFEFAVEMKAFHPEWDEGFTVTPEVLASFEDYVTRREIEFTAEEFEDNVGAMKTFIRAQHAATHDGLAAGDRVHNESDPQVQAALDAFPEARELAQAARGVYLSQQRERLDEETY